MNGFEELNLRKNIIEIASLAARTFSYRKSEELMAGNFYVGESEIEGRCGDYALLFVIKWNEKYPDNQAEIVAVNQNMGFKSGSYKIVREISDLIDRQFFKESGWAQNVSCKNGNGRYFDLVFYHTCLWYYEVKQTKLYEVVKHFGYDMVDRGPHVWARVGDIAVDPCWADTDDTPFIGEDIIIDTLRP